MLRLWGPLWALRLSTAAALLAASASASYIRTPSELLLRRADNTCAADDFSLCPQSGLPDGFCCETGATCIVLAGNTTVLCCPKGSNCDKINAITCDITLQDASTNPTAEVKTTALNGFELTTCGDSCCPFGYRCDGTICVKEADQSKKPTPNKPSSSSSTTAPTQTSTAGSSTTVAVSGISTATPAAESTTPAAADTTSTSSTTHTVTIVGGVIGGLVGVVLVIVAVILVRFRRKQQLKKKEQQMQQNHRGSSTSSFGNIISAPVPHANYPNQRLDFLAKQSQTQSASSSPTAVASPPPRPGYAYRGDGYPYEHTYEYGGGTDGNANFSMPPNSPYSPYARRPDSQMSDAPRSYHASAEVSGLRSLTHSKGKQNVSGGRDLFPAPAPLVTVTPAEGEDRGLERQRSGSEGESINIFADPLTVRNVGGGLGVEFGAGRPDSTATTWSNIQHRAGTAPDMPAANQGRLGESPLRRR